MSKKRRDKRSSTRSSTAHKKTTKKKGSIKRKSNRSSAKRHAPVTKPRKTQKKTARKSSAKKVAKKAAKKSPKKAGSAKTKPRHTPRKRVIAGKMVYAFGTKTEGDGSMRELLGGKGANLAEMTSLGLPVPPGFTITTATCAKFYANKKRLPKGLMDDVRAHMDALEKQRDKKFGNNKDPLLVSVRSGAAISMPGMMDTILNLGLNDAAVKGLAEVTGNDRFAFDAYRRLINMFGNVVMGVQHDHFEDAFDLIKTRYNAQCDTDVPAEGLRELCDAYKDVYKHHVGSAFPQSPMKQLQLAIQAVFGSWNSDKAITYRRIEHMGSLDGTAVNVQSMVFGNMGDDSGTGVAFTRNPSTGKNTLYGEFLVNAQGEDVVAGIRTPRPVAEMTKWNKKIYTQLRSIKKILEDHYADMQDIEFTIERGELFMLQTRSGKRTGAAAVKVACDMVREKRIDEKNALLRIPAGDLTQLLLPSFDPEHKQVDRLLTKGLPASPGASVGHPAFSATEAVERSLAGERVILVRKETSPEDIDGMNSAVGILTSTGGMTSHAAVVARGWGKCCVAGAGEIHIDEKGGTFAVRGQTFGRGDLISIDGTTVRSTQARSKPRSPSSRATLPRSCAGRISTARWGSAPTRTRRRTRSARWSSEHGASG
jgi:pyruvate,orthophosphate dikinase